jgi:glycosyltransferase involved in cell wall biosynthesis
MSEAPERPPIADARLSLVLRARNAEAFLPELVRSWAGFLSGRKCAFEILVVDDASSDRTPAMVESLAQDLANVRLLRPKNGQGFGAALRAGIGAAQHPLLCYAPADRRYRPGCLQKLLERIDLADLVTGCRAGRPVPGALRGLGFIYRWLIRIVLGIGLDPLPGWPGWRGWLYQKLIRSVFGLRLHDVDCPIKLFRRQVLERIPIQSDGSFVHAEVLAKANFIGCLVDEVALAIDPDDREPGWWAELRRVYAQPEFGTNGEKES